MRWEDCVKRHVRKAARRGGRLEEEDKRHRTVENTIR